MRSFTPGRALQMKSANTVLSISVTIVLLAGAIITPGQRVAPQRAHVVILSTTDMHGRVFPIDYYTNKYENVGIAKVATLVKEARKNDPDLLLLDSGDTIQGTPLEYFHNKRNNTPLDPMMLAMNALHYDAMVVGNHEYNFGLQVLDKARSEAQFQWLSANTYETQVKGGESNYYKPYII
jgi:2',3'-cyclic-nucleotide 2'-phosphodiesterase/3'-nucleotidase